MYQNPGTAALPGASALPTKQRCTCVNTALPLDAAAAHIGPFQLACDLCHAACIAGGQRGHILCLQGQQVLCKCLWGQIYATALDQPVRDHPEGHPRDDPKTPHADLQETAESVLHSRKPVWQSLSGIA